VLDLLCSEDSALPGLLVQGLRLLEDDALGGGGSRGSGCVRFDALKLTWRGKDYYASGAAEREIASGVDLAALQAKVQELGDSLGEQS
jgi:CRISPR-associated protein Csm3